MSWYISRWFRDIKLEWPIFTSTSPLELLRPMVMRVWRIMYSKSLPSNRAMADPFPSGFHDWWTGLAGADFPVKESNAKASFSADFCNVAMPVRYKHSQNGFLTKAKQPRSLVVYISGRPRIQSETRHTRTDSARRQHLTVPCHDQRALGANDQIDPRVMEAWRGHQDPGEVTLYVYTCHKWMRCP